MAVLLGHELAGPGVTAIEAARATEGLFPALEIVELRTDEKKKSLQMNAVTQKTSGGIVVGGPMCSHRGIDLRLKGVVLSLNGEPRASGTAIEVLGNPFNVVAIIANKIAEFGESLRSGMILMTGAVVPMIAVSSGDDVRAEFTRLGSVCARFAR